MERIIIFQRTKSNIIKIDWYTKFILTVIAVLLLGILVKPSIRPQKAKADSVEYFYVENNYKNPIPVEIVNRQVEVRGEVKVDGSVEISNSWDSPLWIQG